MMEHDELLKQLRLLQRENQKLKEEVKKLRQELVLFKPSTVDFQMQEMKTKHPQLTFNKNSSSTEKIELFKSLFKGREDVCAKKWKNKSGYSPYCHNDFVSGVCYKPKVKCINCKNSSFAPLDDKQIENHLLGNQIIGLYPLTKRDTCFLCVIDFDKSTWKDDVKSVREVCAELGYPVYAERSQSGNGCHLWFFFEEEIKASLARKFVFSILDKSMQKCSSLGFDSFDRLFPSQDFLQEDGFGNLIALPLQKQARGNHNSVFIDDKFIEIEDQWQLLARIQRISKHTIDKQLLETKKEYNEPIVDTIFDSKQSLNKNDFPPLVTILKNNGLLIPKIGISSKGLYKLRRLASYFNPEYYLKQKLRKSTFGTPIMSVHYIETEKELLLPRGIEEELINSFNQIELPLEINNVRKQISIDPLEFTGTLNTNQDKAFEALDNEENGVLSAPTGFGKTVVGAKLVASKSISSLVLVHTKELAYQWIERLEQFIQYRDPSEVFKVGLLGVGKNKLNGKVDVALIQSMFDKDKQVKELIDHYSLIIVDECHHISALNFSRVMQISKAKYVYGLSATAYRKDGHNPIIFMECGPLRYTVDMKKDISKHAFSHILIPRFTSFRLPIIKNEKDLTITEIFSIICDHKDRNALITNDIVKAVSDGRHPLVLSQWTQHLDTLVGELKDKGFEVIVLTGKLKQKERKKALERIRELKESDHFVVIASGKLIGEGFDMPILDTLFLAMPVSWKGTMIQYIGRLHRNYQGKNDVSIYDYVDIHVPVLERMYHKRLSTYRKLEYQLKTTQISENQSGLIYSEDNYLDVLKTDIINAKKYIVFSSPYLQIKKLEYYKNLFVEKLLSGTKILIYASRERNNLNSDVLNDLVRQGVEVKWMDFNLYNFVSLDGNLVWYGDISILGQTFRETSLLRIEDGNIALELEETLKEEV